MRNQQLNEPSGATPRRMSTRHRLSIIGAFLVGTLAVGGISLAGAGTASTTDTQGMMNFADGSAVDGESHLTRTDNDVFVLVEGEGLVAGDAHTLWFIVFNQPANCSDECGENDIFNEDGTLYEESVEAAEIGIGNATGNIARADGTIELGGHLVTNGGPAGHQILFPAGLVGDSLLTVGGDDAEVHVILQSHGNARGGKKLLEQLSMVDANCTPTCADLQAAVHTPAP
jgi:hypothetical protein